VRRAPQIRAPSAFGLRPVSPRCCPRACPRPASPRPQRLKIQDLFSRWQPRCSYPPAGAPPGRSFRRPPGYLPPVVRACSAIRPLACIVLEAASNFPPFRLFLGSVHCTVNFDSALAVLSVAPLRAPTRSSSSGTPPCPGSYSGTQCLGPSSGLRHPVPRAPSSGTQYLGLHPPAPSASGSILLAPLS